MASLAEAATNLNSSKSNVYRVIHDDRHGDKEPKNSIILLGNAQNESAAADVHEREKGRKHVTGTKYK